LALELTQLLTITDALQELLTTGKRAVTVAIVAHGSTASSEPTLLFETVRLATYVAWRTAKQPQPNPRPLKVTRFETRSISRG
jgi:hypothetical protein